MATNNVNDTMMAIVEIAFAANPIETEYHYRKYLSYLRQEFIKYERKTDDLIDDDEESYILEARDMKSARLETEVNRMELHLSRIRNGNK